MSEEQRDATEDAIHQVVSIVSAYVSHNSMRAADLPEFIAAVHASIRQLAKGPTAPEVKQPDTPAVPVKKSVNRDYIICLEDGKKFKSLRRHLSSFHHLTPDEYRAKWNLPSDYPMVAPAYSATRSQLAKDSGLGQVSRSGEGEIDEAPPTAAEYGAELQVADTPSDEAISEPARAAAPRPADEPVDEPADQPAEEQGDGHDGAAEAVEPPKKPKRGRPKKNAAA